MCCLIVTFATALAVKSVSMMTIHDCLIMCLCRATFIFVPKIAFHCVWVCFCVYVNWNTRDTRFEKCLSFELLSVSRNSSHAESIASVNLCSVVTSCKSAPSYSDQIKPNKLYRWTTAGILYQKIIGWHAKKYSRQKYILSVQNKSEKNDQNISDKICGIKYRWTYKPKLKQRLIYQSRNTCIGLSGNMYQ